MLPNGIDAKLIAVKLTLWGSGSIYVSDLISWGTSFGLYYSIQKMMYNEILPPINDSSLYL
jgi:hypothetical protein